MATRDMSILVKVLFLFVMVHAMNACDLMVPCTTQPWCKYKIDCYKYDEPSPISAGEVKGIEGKCEKHEGKWALRLSWKQATKQENLLYYVVRFLIPNDADGYCVCFNASKSTSFLFSKSLTFREGTDYEAAVTAMPVTSDQVTNFHQIKGCPRKGLVSWEPWSPCKCNEIYKDYCKGVRTRSFHCVSKQNRSIELQRNNCNDPPKYEEFDDQCIGSVPLEKTKFGRDNVDDDTFDSTTFVVTILGIIIVVVAIIAFLIHHNRKGQIVITDARIGKKDSPEYSVYVSHLVGKKKRDESLVLQLALELSRYRIRCFIDILEENDITKVGGKHIWIPNKIHSSDVLLVFLTKDYLRGFYASQDNECDIDNIDDELCQMQSELRHANYKLYKSLQRRPLIILILNGVKPQEIPIDFCGRPYVNYPEKFDESDDDFLKLFGILTNTEPIQLEAII